MGSPENDSDEPLTPAGRLFLQPQMDQIIHCVIGLKYPIDIPSIKTIIANSFMAKHPRFSSLLVRDASGVEHWRKTQIDIDKHLVVVKAPVSEAGDDERAVNEYLADLTVSTPLSADKPLWEFHFLMAHKCAVLRIHHALGDGVSLMSMFLASCRRVDDPEVLPTVGVASRRRDNGDWKRDVLKVLKMVWLNLVYVVEFCLRPFWLCDPKTDVSGGAGVELWPRKLVTARFWLEDMKKVKAAVADATINDVLFGVISYGLSKYLDHRSQKSLPEGLQLTGLAMVNLREQLRLQDLSDITRNNLKSGWGNKFGMLLLPVYYYKVGTDPLLYLKRAKTMIDRKKLSLEAHFSYRIGYFVMKYFGAKAACMLNYRVVCNTTFTISNVVGPKEEIALGCNPITYLRATTCGLPHALTMHMVSYAERADMQILVAKDIIPDPEFLSKCFEDALLEMKKAALANK